MALIQIFEISVHWWVGMHNLSDYISKYDAWVAPIQALLTVTFRIEHKHADSKWLGHIAVYTTNSIKTVEDMLHYGTCLHKEAWLWEMIDSG